MSLLPQVYKVLLSLLRKSVKDKKRKKRIRKGKKKRIIYPAILSHPERNCDYLLNKSVLHLPVLPAPLGLTSGLYFPAHWFLWGRAEPSASLRLNFILFTLALPYQGHSQPTDNYYYLFSPLLPKWERAKKPQITEECFLSGWEFLNERESRASDPSCQLLA